MIGQVHLLQFIDKLIADGNFPRFSIVVGSPGSERNKIAGYVADKMSAICAEVSDCKVDTVRDVIFNSYKVEVPTIYNIIDVDSMSLQARNAMLKVTEEPPNKAYFVMTLDDINNTLPTLKSRGIVFEMEPYSVDDLARYCQKVHKMYISGLSLFADTPGDVDMLASLDVLKFQSFVEKVADNIATASGSNAFKIAQSIKMKDSDETGYDLRMFWKVFCAVCKDKKWFNGLRITSKFLSLLKVKAINKAMLFDKWILDIREAWVDGNS